MTTIVYKDGYLASDSRVTLGNIIVGDNYKKIFHIKGFGYIGMSGSVHHIQILLKHFRSTKCLDSTPEGIDSLNLDAIFVPEQITTKHKPVCLCISKGSIVKYPFTRATTWHTIGSGSHIAMAAILANPDISAKEAVLIASKMDVFTNNKVKVIKCQ